MANQNASSRGPIFSEYANDADMAELVEGFVAELPKRIEAISSAVSQSRGTDLKRLAHQLRGAAPGYGFPSEHAALPPACRPRAHEARTALAHGTLWSLRFSFCLRS